MKDKNDTPGEADTDAEEKTEDRIRPGARESARGERLWIPKTKLGRSVAEGKYKSLDEILERGKMILESGIVDALVPDLKDDIIYIGGSPGKGGGIRRTATKRTARMHKSGRRFTLTALVVVGDGRGIVGIGKSSSREHRIALEKATEQAKLNVIMVKKGCGSWECGCGGRHSVPFRSEAKSGSVRVVIMPAPKGVGIVADQSSKKILSLAGINDVWLKSFGNTGARTNLAYAVFGALKNLGRTKGDI